MSDSYYTLDMSGPLEVDGYCTECGCGILGPGTRCYACAEEADKSWRERFNGLLCEIEMRDIHASRANSSPHCLLCGDRKTVEFVSKATGEWGEAPCPECGGVQ